MKGAFVLTDEKRWEEALAEYSFDASIGRLFKGLIHNLNGVGQAFSMQTELLSMMFPHADKVLKSIENSDSIEVAHEAATALKDMLAKRSALAEHLTKEVQTMYKIMGRCSSVMEESRDPGRVHAFKLRNVIATEVEFLSADSFFKHKVSKDLVLADDIPALSSYQVQLHKILSVLIENASQAMEKGTCPEGDKAKISISSSINDAILRIDVEDNGPGVADTIRHNLFDPFVSGNNRLGLGLYLARGMAEGFKGNISFDSRPGRTCFSLLFPLSEVAGETTAGK